ncbi:MAG: hypothetical protein JNJ54_30855 [Myxococcaceae bacterium]|nr:hypothetical protein [Myxococcaceae bacterium]
MLPLALVLVLAQSPDGGVPTVVQAPPPLDPEPTVHLSAGAEGELGLLPSGSAENGVDLMFGFRPMVGMAVGDVFSIQLGPLIRLRVIDTPPLDRARDLGGVVRGQDWDRSGDFGELLQSLRIGTETSTFHLKAGPIHKKTLGLGHLLFRYSNRLNADARPSAATAVLSVSFLRFEVFASDIFAGRLFAAEVTWDIGRSFSGDASAHGRFMLSLSGGHDFAVGTPAAVRGPVCQAEQPCEPASVAMLEPSSLVHLDVSAVLLRSSTISLMLVAGLGARATASRDLGFLLGGAMDVRLSDVEVSLRAEGRKQAGAFRHGYFGPQYELARFSGIGFGFPALASEMLPDAFSVFGELRLRLLQLITVDGAVEAFTFGRTDFDTTLSVELLEKKLIAEARVGAVGLGQAPRWLLTAGLRWRLFTSFYVLGSGGTVFFPAPDGHLVRGVMASAGVGVDIER